MQDSICRLSNTRNDHEKEDGLGIKHPNPLHCVWLEI